MPHSLLEKPRRSSLDTDSKLRFLLINTLLMKNLLQSYSLLLFSIISLATLNGNTPTSKQTIFDVLQEEVKEITITMPFDSVVLNKKTDKSFAGTVSFLGKNSTKYNKSIEVKARGKSRRMHCSFPPLRIEFSKADLKKYGLRSAHRSLKLVTHCNVTANATDNVLKEYLTYKIYNELTENSLQVQLFKINYVDSNDGTTMTKYGFFVEDIDELAERLGGVEDNTFGKLFTDFDPVNANHFALFQFMIGNEDWAIEHRRNVRYIHLEKSNQFLVIPYDFDMSGLVATEYARPNINLGLQCVTQRLFMGDFENRSSRTKALKHFRSKRKMINELINTSELLSTSERTYMKAYVASFFDVIKDSELLSQAIPHGRRTPRKIEFEVR